MPGVIYGMVFKRYGPLYPKSAKERIPPGRRKKSINSVGDLCVFSVLRAPPTLLPIPSYLSTQTWGRERNWLA